MLQLLIVDDEIPTVQATKIAIDWEKFGIGSVYTAFDINQAKETFRNYSIDILLCDIEMPQGNGLDLLVWVKNNYPDTETIFLTCHADFEYAQQALKLGIEDYLLKPLPPEELEQVISKATKIIYDKRKLKTNSSSWIRNQSLFIERFWLDILNEKISSEPKKINKLARDRNISFNENMRYLPVMVRIQQWHEALGLDDEKLMEFALKNSLEEMIIKGEEKGIVIELRRGTLLALINLEEGFVPDKDTIKTELESYIEICQQHFFCDLSCYIGKAVYAHELLAIVSKLSEIDKNNVTCKSKVFLLSESAVVQNRLTIPDMNIWAMMLEQGLKEKVLSEINDYFKNRMGTEELDAIVLHQFQHDFLQMVYSVLKKQGIQAHKLLSDENADVHYLQPARSVMDLMAWIAYVLEKARSYVNEVEKVQSVIEKVKKYITVNIEQKITCEDIANHVYLNPDYLTRIFKKETGITLSEYLLQERIKMAKDMLLKTDMPISAVAAHIGYTNLAHFSRIFKKYTNMNPFDYKNNVNKEHLYSNN